MPDTKLYVPVVTLSTQGNAKLLKQLESGCERTINWNNYQSKKIMRKTDILVVPTFQAVNRLFDLSPENENDLESYKRLPSNGRNKRLQCYDR